MKLLTYFEDSDSQIPAETIWGAFDKRSRSKAFRMLRNGELQAEGRLLNTCMTSHHIEPYEDRITLCREMWEDAFDRNWLDEYDAEKKLQLNRRDSEQIYVEILIFNSPELRGLAGYETLIGSIEGFDEIFMKQMNAKIGSKAFAVAGGALAAGKVNPTATALSKYLLEKDDLWPKGTIDERNLKAHLATFVKEYLNNL